MSDLWTFTLVHWQHCYFNSYFSVLFITSSGNYPNSHDIEHSFESAFRSYFGMQTFFWHSGHIFWTEKKKALIWFGNLKCISGNNRGGYLKLECVGKCIPCLHHNYRVWSKKPKQSTDQQTCKSSYYVFALVFTWNLVIEAVSLGKTNV